MKRSKWILLSVTLSVLCGFAFWVVHSVVETVTVVVPNAYALEWASVFVIEHMDANDNRWPTSWADLKDEFDRQVATGHAPAATWQELQSRVIIDWDVNVDSLVTADPKEDPPFRAIWLSDGTNSHWEGSEPNRKVLEYLLKCSEIERQK